MKQYVLFGSDVLFFSVLPAVKNIELTWRHAIIQIIWVDECAFLLLSDFSKAFEEMPDLIVDGLGIFILGLD